MEKRGDLEIHQYIRTIGREFDTANAIRLKNCFNKYKNKILNSITQNMTMSLVIIDLNIKDQNG